MALYGLKVSTRPRPHRGARSPEDGLDPVPEVERLQLEAVHQAGAQEQALEGVGPAAGRERGAHGFGGDAAVEGALEDELHEALEIELVGRHPEHDARRRRGRVAHRAAVADGAVEADVIDADAMAARHADGQIVARLDDEAERRRSRPGADRGRWSAARGRPSTGGSTPPTGRSSDTPGSLPIDPYLKWSSIVA